MAAPASGSASALSAQVVGAMGNLELAARVVVEGMRAGRHRSPFHGFSAEFQQHRPYRHGDGLKHLDWKLLARTDRLYTRQYRESTNLSALLVLDTSASMAFPEQGISRFRLAQVLAAALAHLTVTAGDSAGLLTLEEGRPAFLPPRAGRTHLRSLIARIDGLEPGGVWDGARALDRAGQLLRRRGVIVVISDFYDDEARGLQGALRRAASRGHDVMALQLTSPDETDFPYTGELEFQDLESGRRRRVRAEAVAEAYRAAVADFHRGVREAALRDGVDHALISTDQAPAVALRDLLLRRRRVG